MIHTTKYHPDPAARSSEATKPHLWSVLDHLLDACSIPKDNQALRTLSCFLLSDEPVGPVTLPVLASPVATQTLSPSQDLNVQLSSRLQRASIPLAYTVH
jgi:hypothetical protein